MASPPTVSLFWMRASRVVNVYWFKLRTEFELWLKLWQVGRAFAGAGPTFIPGVPAFTALVSGICLFVILILGLSSINFSGFSLPSFPKFSEFSSLFSSPQDNELPDGNVVGRTGQSKNELASVQLKNNKSEEVATKPQKRLPLPGNLSYLVASKADRTMFFFMRDGREWKLVRKYDLVYGGVEGDKITEGDRRTPEGNYWVTGILPGPPTGELYGTLILPLSYPNAVDRQNGKTGSGIWIHGSQWGEEKTPTRGCLKLGNAVMVELAKEVTIPAAVSIVAGPIDVKEVSRSVPRWILSEYTEQKMLYDSVNTRSPSSWTRERVIATGEEFLNNREAAIKEMAEAKANEPKEAAGCREFLTNWSEEWSQRNFDNYAKRYDANFESGQGQNREAFLARKKRIFSIHDKFEVSLSSIKCKEQEDHKYVVRFVQSYHAYRNNKQVNALNSSKEMVLAYEQGAWSILRE